MRSLQEARTAGGVRPVPRHPRRAAVLYRLTVSTRDDQDRLEASERFRAFVHQTCGMADAILDAVPQLDEAAEELRRRIADWIGVVINAPDALVGVTLASSQAGNEVLDLLFDCCTGRGRPALKASRSLFELLLTMKDIVSDTAACERYEDHRWVAFGMALDLDKGRPVRRKGEAHHRKKAERIIRPEYERVLAQYGGRFRLGWREGTLAGAADRHDLQDDYEFYRLASAVLHGSSGGVLGQYVIDQDAQVPVYRTGPALDLCPDALERGMAYFEQLAELTHPWAGDVAVELAEACRAVRQTALAYRSYLEDTSSSWWATVPRGMVVAVAAVDALGRCRWYLHDTGSDQIRLANPPRHIPDEAAAYLKEIVDERTAGRSLPGIGDDEVVSVLMIGCRATPKRGSTWRPTLGVLQQKSLFGERVDVELPLGWLRDR